MRTYFASTMTVAPDGREVGVTLGGPGGPGRATVVQLTPHVPDEVANAVMRATTYRVGIGETGVGFVALTLDPGPAEEPVTFDVVVFDPDVEA